MKRVIPITFLQMLRRLDPLLPEKYNEIEKVRRSRNTKEIENGEGRVRITNEIQNGEHRSRYTKEIENGEGRVRNANRSCVHCHRADINKGTLEL